MKNITLLACLLIAATIGLPQKADAVIVKFLFKLDKDEFGNYLFGHNVGVAVDPNSGHILGLDRAGFVSVFDSNGQFLFRFGGFSDDVDKLSQPTGITVHPDSSNIVVVERDSHEVSVFDLSGNFLFKFGSICVLNHPSQQGCVDPDGAGPLEYGDGQFAFPSDVAVDPRNGNIVVADKDNDRVQVFDSAGNFLFKSAPNFNNPFGIAVDPNSGNIALAYGNIVAVLDPTGAVLFQISSTSENDLSEPFGVSFDPVTSQIFVADTIPGTSLDELDIQVYDRNGNFLYKYGTRCDLLNNNVGCVDPDGSGPLELGDGQFGVPADVEISPVTGHMVTGDSHLNRLQVFELINEAPELTARLQAVDLSPGSGLFQVQLTVTDDTDPNPTVQADINGIPVINGQLVNLVPGDLLSATATDELGNQTSASDNASFVEIPPAEILIIGTVELNLSIEPGQTLTIDGTVNGNVKARGGEVIVNPGSVVNGNVKVKEAGLLTIRSSTVSGDVTGDNCTSLRIFGNTTVGGLLTAKGCETVQVFDSNVTGDVILKKNTSVSFSSNIVGDDLIIKDNTTCIVSGFNQIVGKEKVIGCTLGGGGGGL